MNDKIKDIIEHLIKYKNEVKKMKYQPEDILTIEDVWLMLDYISYNKNILTELEEWLKETRINSSFIDELTLMEVQLKIQELKEKYK